MCCWRAILFFAGFACLPRILLAAEGVAATGLPAPDRVGNSSLDATGRQVYVLFDPPWWAYILLLSGFVALLVWMYLKKRWIRIGLIGTVVTGFFVIPGFHFVIEELGPAKGIDLRLSDPDFPAVLLGCVAIIVLGILEWPYSKADFQSSVHERAAARAGIMRTATRLVMQEHLGRGTSLEELAKTHNIATADLYAALHCALEVQTLLE